MGLYPSAAKVLARANEIIFDDLSREMFISAFYAILDMPTRTLTCANAGHHPLLVYRKAAKSVERYLKVGGMALRMGRGAPFVQALADQPVQLQSGDIAFFYTDGLSEAMGPRREEFGEARLEAAVLKYGNNTVDDFLKRIEAEVSNHRAGTEPNDDLTMLALKAL
jgi:sigma-B regulation protein RsbU (phosphoserine phosphatase)